MNHLDKLYADVARFTEALQRQIESDPDHLIAIAMIKTDLKRTISKVRALETVYDVDEKPLAKAETVMETA